MKLMLWKYSYAGGMVARNLDEAAKAGKIRLTLVDKRDAMQWVLVQYSFFFF